MTWILLILNIVTLVISTKKRVLPYSIFTAIFLFLVVGQAFQLQADFEQSSALYYPYSTISERGFSNALWYVLIVSLVSLILTWSAKGYKAYEHPRSLYSFAPSRTFYAIMLAILCLVAGILIIGVVGLSSFLTMSRPGNLPGATLFITLMSIGIFPLLLKVICQNKIRSGDLACFGIALFVTAGFSRLHVILYLLVLLTALFYARGWADRAFSVKTFLLFAVFGVILLFFFFTLGAIRDALNYTRGSIGELISYNLDHPETSLLSVQYTYRVSIEGMSGVAGAFTEALTDPGQVQRDYGTSAGLDGLAQMLPAVAKDSIRDVITSVQSLYWYQKPAGNVSPGIETSFVSFGWFGAFLYPCLFFAVAWKFPMLSLSRKLSPQLKLVSHMFIGCGIFFVRGTWADWIAFSVSYAIIILLVWSLFSIYFKNNSQVTES